MNDSSPVLTAIISEAISSGKEVSLKELIVALGLSDDGYILDQLEEINNFLSTWGLSLQPPMTTGDLATQRILRTTHLPILSPEDILNDIGRGETSDREFKSSLHYHHKRATFVPETPLNDLKSEEVLHSSLKTIAALLNCGGGTLYIGVDDTGHPLGLESDCRLLGCTAFDGDKWEIDLRNQITGKFKDGNSLNDYIQVRIVSLQGNSVACLSIQARRGLAFLKKRKSFHLYRRQGNRTTEVMIYEVEDFLEFRRSQGWS